MHIVADDLTGALDSAAVFAGRGARVRVATGPEGLGEALASAAEVVAVSTNSRDGSAAEATDAARRVAADLAGRAGLLFKKIDSRLKGHIAAELAELVPQHARLVVNPSIPRVGRTCHGGAVTGAGVAEPIPIAPRIGRAVSVHDTDSAGALAAILPADLTSATYVGAAGLAEALADRLYPGPVRDVSRLPRPAILAIGSRDPVTAAQVAALAGVPICDAPNGVATDLPRAPCLVLRMTQGAAQVSGPEAAAAFAGTLARAHDALRPATLFACGGDSAAALLARLGIGQLDVAGEVLPGVPVSRDAGGAGPWLVTKSGGFGEADTLVKLVNRLTAG
ncbi:four-carbon acid sugar kinase family protein [Roseivivax sp. CAU 1761]